MQMQWIILYELLIVRRRACIDVSLSQVNSLLQRYCGNEVIKIVMSSKFRSWRTRNAGSDEHALMSWLQRYSSLCHSTYIVMIQSFHLCTAIPRCNGVIIVYSSFHTSDYFRAIESRTQALKWPIPNLSIRRLGDILLYIARDRPATLSLKKKHNEKTN
jgi:hypothetical protein